jgi:hypothetical protein
VQDQQTSRHSNRQSEDIDHRKQLVLDNNSERGFDVVLQHDATVYSYLKAFTGSEVAALIA